MDALTSHFPFPFQSEPSSHRRQGQRLGERGGGIVALAVLHGLATEMPCPVYARNWLIIRRPAGASCGSCLLVVVLSVLSLSLSRA